MKLPTTKILSSLQGARQRGTGQRRIRYIIKYFTVSNIIKNARTIYCIYSLNLKCSKNLILFVFFKSNIVYLNLIDDIIINNFSVH